MSAGTNLGREFIGVSDVAVSGPQVLPLASSSQPKHIAFLVLEALRSPPIVPRVGGEEGGQARKEKQEDETVWSDTQKIRWPRESRVFCSDPSEASWGT